MARNRSSRRAVSSIGQENRHRESVIYNVQSKNEEGTAAWKDLLGSLEDRDKQLIDSWRDELNNLLIFAGLFSAVVTAFTVQSYSWLQQDSLDTATQLLAQISLQLTSFTISNGYINSTTPALPIQNITSTFTAAPMAVNTNVLWVLSLTLSLGAAFFTIMVQQWLRQLPLPQRLAVREAVRLRQLRYQGLTEWQIPGIVLLLPLLLQIAVLFFLVGLYLLLQSLNWQVAEAFTIVVGIGILLFAVPAVVPLISIRCPYKAPLIPTILVVFQWLSYPVTLLVTGIAKLVVSAGGVIRIAASSKLYDRVFTRYVKNPVEKLNKYTSEFGKHIVVDLESFWKEREASILLQTESDEVDKEAILSGLEATRSEAFDYAKLCLQDLPQLDRTKCALLAVARTLGRFTQKDVVDFSNTCPVRPEMLDKAPRLLAKQHRDLMMEVLPDWTEGHWMSKDNALKSILVLLHASAWPCEEFVKLVMTIRSYQKLNEGNFGSLGERIPTILLFEQCRKYAFVDQDISKLVAWARELCRYGETKAPDHFHFGDLEAILASSVTALTTIRRSANVPGCLNELQGLLHSLNRILENNGELVQETAQKAGEDQHYGLITPEALKDLGACLVGLARQGFLPFQNQCPSHVLVQLLRDIYLSSPVVFVRESALAKFDQYWPQQDGNAIPPFAGIYRPLSTIVPVPRRGESPAAYGSTRSGSPSERDALVVTEPMPLTARVQHTRPPNEQYTDVEASSSSQNLLHFPQASGAS